MDLTEQLSAQPKISFALAAIVLWSIYWIIIFINRIYFSPISHIPGPKLAAATFWYEFYYDVYPKKFQYLWKIRELHEQYGPIVRINPIHVHIHDHDYYETIYAAGQRKRNRDPWYMHAGAKALSGGMVETIDHNLHRMRRKPVEPFFSKSSVRMLEHEIVAKVEKLLARFKSAIEASREVGLKDKAIVNLSDAMSGLTLDVISDYCFGNPMGALDRVNYGHDFVDVLHQGIQTRPFGRQFPLLMNTMLDAPLWIMVKLNKALGGIVKFQEEIADLIDNVKAEKAGEKPISGSGRRTVFHELLDKNLPEEEKDTEVLKGFGMNFLGAGTETTARTLAVTCYYLLSNRDKLEKLRTELRTVLPDTNAKPSLPSLEALPYLSAVINEGLRCAHGVSARQPRVPVDEDLQFKQYKLPRGTPLMQSLYLLHMDPAVYPEPLKFRPERYLENPKLLRHHFPFSKGSMSCLGINLATAELYLTVAYIIRWMDMEVVDTIEARDVLTTYDCFIGLTDLQSDGIKIRLLKEVEV